MLEKNYYFTNNFNSVVVYKLFETNKNYYEM